MVDQSNREVPDNPEARHAPEAAQGEEWHHPANGYESYSIEVLQRLED